VGGFGSGRYGFSRTKRTVDGSLVLDLAQMQREKRLQPGEWGTLTWKHGESVTGQVGYAIPENMERLELTYTATINGESDNVRQSLGLSRIPAPYGGFRYFVHCPRCLNRFTKLCLPSGARLFACRKCYDLTYQSSKDSHKFDSFFRSVGLSPQEGKRLFTGG